MTGQVDHNVLRHLNIEKDSEQYKKFEYPNPSGLTEKLQKNIENLQTMPTLNETVHVPSLEEKANIREKMFSFLDESRMEETRLVRNACMYVLLFILSCAFFSNSFCMWSKATDSVTLRTNYR